MALASLISWLRECYREDHSRIGVRDFMSSAVMHRKVLNGKEKLLNQDLTSEVLAPSYSSSAIPYQELYQREKEAIYGSLFICGIHEEKPVRAPLLLAPVLFSNAESSFFEINCERMRMNPAASLILNLSPEQERVIELCLQKGEINDLTISEIVKQLQPHLDTSAMIQWPELLSTRQINATRKKDALGLTLHDKKSGCHLECSSM